MIPAKFKSILGKLKGKKKEIHFVLKSGTTISGYLVKIDGSVLVMKSGHDHIAAGTFLDLNEVAAFKHSTIN